MSMKFSIIIPTYNNSEYLKVCLHSLLLQDFPKSEYEIIVVDDASTENIKKVSSEVLSDYMAYSMLFCMRRTLILSDLFRGIMFLRKRMQFLKMSNGIKK